MEPQEDMDSQEEIGPQEEVQNKEIKLVNFTDSIFRLENRANASRRRVTLLTWLLFMSVLLTLSAVMYNVFRTSEAPSVTVLGKAFYSISDEGKSKSYNEIFNDRTEFLLDQLKVVEKLDGEEKGLSKSAREMSKYIQEEMEMGIKNLENITRIMNMDKEPKDNTSAITSSIGSAVFSLGGVAFVIMLIQITVTFMRYHTRLAELYDAQADALRASNGDAELAYKFIEHFSPNGIELGKAPTTLYEKAMDTIKEVATKK